MLNRPDVIQRLLTAGSVAKALEQIDRENKVTTRSAVVEVADVAPPEITLSAPKLKEKDPKLQEPTVEVEAVVQGGKSAVKSLQLLLDGRPLPEGKGLQLLLDGRPLPEGKGLRSIEGAKPGEKLTRTWTVTLTEGEHTLRVMARTGGGMGLSNDLDVVYDKPVPKPKLFVLAIGIDTYQDRNVPRLHCAVADAVELAKTFQTKSTELFEVHLEVLKDEEATRAGILKKLAWLSQMQEQDTAIIFYAGHGEKEGKSFVLLPHDVQLANLLGTGITGETLKEELTKLKGRILLMLDACHSGKIGRAITDITRDLSDEDCGVVVLCAALGTEKAGEQNGHGFFSKALLEVLNGQKVQTDPPADPPKNPRDGKVYLHHMEQWINDRVKELSKDEQHPTSAKPAIRSFAVTRP
jgi:hypothetical protein